MHNMIQTIKKAALDAVEASKPMNVLFGTVTSTKPMLVKIDQKLTLNQNFLLITKTAKELPLVTGDSVILLRVQGGQKYLILDKVGGFG